MDRVKDKVIVITGAASGLGLADSRVLAREGAHVVMTDIDPEAGQAHANEIGAHFIAQDVSEEASWQNVMREVESHFGRLDGLVNNAGIAPIANIEDTTTDVWRRVMGIHLDATFWGCQSAIALIDTPRTSHPDGCPSRVATHRSWGLRYWQVVRCPRC